MPRITSVRTVVVNAEMRNWVFVKVETEQPGLYGWGEASLEWKTRAVVGAVEDFAPMLIGEDPTRIEHLYQKLYRQSFWRLGRYRHVRHFRNRAGAAGTFSASRSACRSTSCWAARSATRCGCTRTSAAAT